MSLTGQWGLILQESCLSSTAQCLLHSFVGAQKLHVLSTKEQWALKQSWHQKKKSWWLTEDSVIMFWLVGENFVFSHSSVCFFCSYWVGNNDFMAVSGDNGAPCGLSDITVSSSCCQSPVAHVENYNEQFLSFVADGLVALQCLKKTMVLFNLFHNQLKTLHRSFEV